MKTKKIILALAFSLFYFSGMLAQDGYHHGGHHGHKGDGHKHETLVGKTFLVHYTDGDYKLTFVSDSTIKWADAKAKTTDGTVYNVTKINRGIYLSSWDEKSGGSLSQVIDMHGKKIYTAKLNSGKKIVNSVATLTPEVTETTTPAQPATTPGTTTPSNK